MKKLVSLLLALALILAMGIPAFAENTTTITIENASGRHYVGYQLLKVTASLKTGEHHPATCYNTNHKADCYNYAYTVNDAYRAILQAETLENGRNELWDESGKPTSSDAVTDEQILKYLEGQTSGNGTMRQVADRVYREIQAANLSADAHNLTGNNDVISQGYWMIVDVTVLNSNASNSMVMVDTAGDIALTITPKTALPTIEKKVKDIEDTEDSNIADNDWIDTADHDIGDDVPFKLTATLPENVLAYKSYKIVFHDTLSKGLTLNKDSVKVLMYESKHRADADSDLNDGTDVTTAFTISDVTTLDNGSSTFTINCDNVLSIEGATRNTAFVVYYEATLNKSAVVGKGDGEIPGNPNTVYLEFSNNPYGDQTGNTEEDTVTVFTYKMVINKTDSHGHALQGAGFTLYKKLLDSDTDDGYVQVGNVQGGKDSTETTFEWIGLDDGDYKLVESTVPEGYNKMEDIEFSISATHSQADDGTFQLTLLDGGKMGIGDTATGTISKEIINQTGTVLPETGAKGTVMLITISTLFVMVAAVFMVTRKKMSIYED